MKVVFIGTTHFGLRCLKLLHGMPCCEVVGIVTAPRTFNISYRPAGLTNVLHGDVASFASDHNLPCRTIATGMSDTQLFKEVKAWCPDIFLVVGWYHMIPAAWRKVAPAYGLHASLLPDYSGGAPLVWAMIEGESKTGITFFQMDDGVDSGPIIGQSEEPIYDRDTIGSLYARIEQRGLDLLSTQFPHLANGSAQLKSQQGLARRVRPQRGPEDGRIDWRTDSQFVDRFIRAQTKPYPGAFSVLYGRHVIIWAGRIFIGTVPHLPIGTLFVGLGGCCVVCGAGALLLEEIQIEDRLYDIEEIPTILSSGQSFEIK